MCKCALSVRHYHLCEVKRAAHRQHCEHSAPGSRGPKSSRPVQTNASSAHNAHICICSRAHARARKRTVVHGHLRLLAWECLDGSKDCAHVMLDLGVSCLDSAKEFAHFMLHIRNLEHPCRMHMHSVQAATIQQLPNMHSAPTQPHSIESTPTFDFVPPLAAPGPHPQLHASLLHALVE